MASIAGSFNEVLVEVEIYPDDSSILDILIVDQDNECLAAGMRWILVSGPLQINQSHFYISSHGMGQIECLLESSSCHLVIKQINHQLRGLLLDHYRDIHTASFLSDDVTYSSEVQQQFIADLLRRIDAA